MKLLRSVTRRGFNVGTAGWFTVLRPNTWFPASRLASRHLGPGLRTEGSGASGAAGTVRWLAMETSIDDRNRTRVGLAIVGALAITSAMLWWIMHP